jgi:hypothetical protein
MAKLFLLGADITSELVEGFEPIHIPFNLGFCLVHASTAQKNWMEKARTDNFASVGLVPLLHNPVSPTSIKRFHIHACFLKALCRLH